MHTKLGLGCLRIARVIAERFIFQTLGVIIIYAEALSLQKSYFIGCLHIGLHCDMECHSIATVSGQQLPRVYKISKCVLIVLSVKLKCSLHHT